MNKPIKMWVCIAEDKYIDENSLSTTRKASIQKEIDRAHRDIQPDFDWKDLKRWGYKCVKVNVTLELV